MSDNNGKPSMRYFNIKDAVTHEVHANERLEQLNCKDEMRTIWKEQLKAEAIIQ